MHDHAFRVLRVPLLAALAPMTHNRFPNYGKARAAVKRCLSSDQIADSVDLVLRVDACGTPR